MKSCDWCRRRLEATVRRDARFCCRKCRQAAWRVRGYSSPLHGGEMSPPADASSPTRGKVSSGDRAKPSLEASRDGLSRGVVVAGPGDGSVVSGHPRRFAYGDPPYPGMAKRLYAKEPTYKGEVDHAALIRRLSTYDGWALSTSAKALRWILPLCPPEARVCAWIKPHSVPPATRGLHNVWEPIIVLQGRRMQPGRADALVRHAARSGGTLPGRKPLAFCAWLFHAMGMLPGDLFDDLYPGSGIVSRAWKEVSPGCRKDDGPLTSSGSGRAVAGGSGRAQA